MMHMRSAWLNLGRGVLALSAEFELISHSIRSATVGRFSMVFPAKGYTTYRCLDFAPRALRSRSRRAGASLT